MKKAYQIFGVAIPVSIIIVLTTFISAWIIFYAAIAPLVKHNGSLSEKQSFPNTEVRDLMFQKAWLNSRLILTERDSAVVSVNLKDSLIMLELKGIRLGAYKILDFSQSEIFSGMEASEIEFYLNKPSFTDSLMTNIKKNDIRYKKAPKDTAEYNAMQKNDVQVQPENDLAFDLILSSGIRLSFRGVSEKGGNCNPGKYKYKLRHMKAIEIIKSIIEFRLPSYHPVIEITITNNDIKTIYRALPENAEIALRPII